MRRPILTFGALGAILLGGIADAGAATAVTVIRGGDVQTVASSSANRSPTVLRGGGSLMLPIAAARPAPADSPAIAAGRTLWLVDKDGRRIVACSLRGTGYIDGRRILCTRY